MIARKYRHVHRQQFTVSVQAKMIPRKKIQFIICTVCILYAFGNTGCVSAGKSEIRTEVPFEFINNTIPSDDNASLNSTVITETFSPSNTPAQSTFTTKKDTLTSNTSVSSDTITETFSPSNTPAESTSTTEEGKETSSAHSTIIPSDGKTTELPSSTDKLRSGTSLNSTTITDAHSKSNTSVENTTITEEGKVTSSARSTIIPSNGTTTELPSPTDTLTSNTSLSSDTITEAFSPSNTPAESTSTTEEGKETSSARSTIILSNGTTTELPSPTDKLRSSTSLTSTTITDAHSKSNTSVENTTITEEAEETSNAYSTIIQSTETTTELPSCRDALNSVQNLTAYATNSTIFVTWEPVTWNDECIKAYHITWYSNSDYLDSNTVNSTESEFTISDLMPCTYYTINVAAIGINSVGDVQTISCNTTESLISQVKELTVTSIENGLSVTWDPPEDQSCLKSYRVNVLRESDDVIFDEGIVYPPDTFYTSDNLYACTNYTVQVTPISINNNSGTVATVSGSKTLASAPGVVSNLTHEQLTGYSVYLSWSAPTLNPDCVHSYNVTSCYANSCTQDNTTELVYNVTNLNPCRTYSFTVRAVGVASSSDEQLTSATTSYISPGKPASPIAMPGQFSLILDWDPPEIADTCTNSYRLTVWATGYTVTTANTYATISNLSACTNYTVQITPVSADGSEGLLTTVANFTEASVNDPPILKVEKPEVTKSTISLVWFIDRTMNQCELKTLLTICNFTSTNGSGFDRVNQQSEYTISDSDSSANVTINDTVKDLSPFSTYNCIGMVQNIVGYSESSTAVTATTEEDVPSAPILRVSSSESFYFTLEWDKPKYLAGNLIQHEILLSWERLFLRPSSCIDENSTTEDVISNIQGFETQHTYSGASAYSQYTATIRAKTNAGWGNYSSSITFNTSSDVPGAVTSIRYANTTNSYNSNLLDTYLYWKLPCLLNGEIEYFHIQFKGERDGFDPDTHNESFYNFSDISADKIFQINFGELKAEYNYTFEISTKVFGVSRWGPSNSYNVIYPAGIPPLPEQWYMDALKLDKYKMIRTSSTVTILLPLFNDANGAVMYYAVMISEYGQSVYSESRFDILSGNWPNTTSWKEAMLNTPIVLYQATPVRWHPNTSNDIFNPGHLQAVKFVLGSDDSCSKSPATYCNGPLRPDTEYQVKMRAFTNGGFRDSQSLLIKTKAEFNLGMVIGVVFGILFFGIITTMMLLVRKGVLQTALSNILNPSVQSSPGPDPFTRKKFELHCQELIDNPRRLGNEFQMLQTLSVDLEMSSNAAELQANRKKNRYINILPYDISRVKLDIVNNDPNSDYINASLIPGYTGGTEYIACQGPKEETTYDFWRMIYQYNVKVIVMVTQLVEKGKDKCHQYYPNTRENFEYEDIMTRCSSQLDFVFYTRRNITLQKTGGVARTVTHLHFKEWSDHGVPDDVHTMINFCQIVRKLITESKGLAVVHCSAGVGRTGTLIAIDILLQQIRDNKKLDVFGTVYKLRQHRMNMVQTESQYAYIYNCTKQALNNPPKHYKTSPVKPVYENLAKTRRKDIVDSNTNLVNCAETLKESSLSPSSEFADPVCEINVPRRPIYASQLSTLSLRYSKSSSAINSQIPPNLELARYGSHEYPIFEPAPDSPLSKVSMDMTGFLDFARPIKIEPRIPRPESTNLGETIDNSMDEVRRNY